MKDSSSSIGCNMHFQSNSAFWEHIAADKLETEARNRVAEIAENAKPLAEHGINRFRDNNCNVYAEKEGNSSGYLTARIARDNPEMLR